MLKQTQTLKFRLQFNYTYPKPLTFQSFPIFINHKPITVHLDKQGYSQILEFSDPLNTDPLSSDSINPKSLYTSDFCKIDHFEMINHKTRFPTHCQTFTRKDLTKLDDSHESGLSIKVLPPPIIVDLHQENALLSSGQVQYFKDNGHNALIFVHGYDLPLGNYGCYPESYEMQPDLAIEEFHYKNSSDHIRNYNRSQNRSYNPNHNQNYTLSFKKSSYPRSIACKLDKPDEILSHFPELLLSYPQHFSRLCHKPSSNPEGLGEKEAFFNGSHATHWFTHMEYNFNYAAGFSGKNFEYYTRILNVHWPSGNGMTEYKLAEKMATQSAGRLVKIIQQLMNENIKIHIIAHSLGARLVLDMLKLLVESKLKLNKIKVNDLKHVQTQVPNSSVSSLNSIDVEYPIEKLVLWQAAIPHTVLFEDPIYCRIPNLVRKINILYSKSDSILQTLYSSAQLNQLSLIKALGYAGPPSNDFVKDLQKAGKLICADQTKLLLGHSFMKIPTEALMREIYQEYIIGGEYGIRQFGLYSLY